MFWKIALVSGFALILCILGYIRFAPIAAEAWHVKPEDATRTGKPNDALWAEGGDKSPLLIEGESLANVADRLDQIALAEPRTRVLAGAAGAGWVTYVQRSRLLAYPDMISVTLTETEKGTELRFFSRSKFGYSDWGVNAERLTRWTDKL